MVGYITVAHGGAQRLSEKWRHFVVHCLYSLFCTSPRCVGVVAVESAFGYTARHARYVRRASRALICTSSPRIARVVTVSLPPPRTHTCAARCDGAHSLARSRACGAAMVMVVWRSVTPRATRITRSAHHARARACHQRAIRASLPFPSPRAHARLRCSGSGARSLPRLRARCVAGNDILGAFRCRSPPSHPTHPSWQSPPNRPVPHRQVRRCSGKAHSRARTAAAAALARSLDRACGVWRLRWRWHAVTLPVTRVTRAARHAHVRIRHHHASRASSPFSVPPVHDWHARATAAAVLARSLGCARAV